MFLIVAIMLILNPIKKIKIPNYEIYLCNFVIATVVTMNNDLIRQLISLFE